MSEARETFDSWAILELMGHLRMAGRVTEEERFGAKMGRIDVPQGDRYVTVYFGGASVYRMTPCSEEVARMVAEHNQPKPVHQWELHGPEKSVEVLDGRRSPRPVEVDRDEDDGPRSYYDDLDDNEYP